MPRHPLLDLDATDRDIIEGLQGDGRQSTAELARAISMSASATADRVRRLEESGVITGYSASVSAEALGFTVTAFVRLAYPTGNYRPFHDLVAGVPEILEAHHITGDDCFLVKVVARSMADLERIVGRLAGLGTVTTNVVYSSPLPGRRLSAPD